MTMRMTKPNPKVLRIITLSLVLAVLPGLAFVNEGLPGDRSTGTATIDSPVGAKSDSSSYRGEPRSIPGKLPSMDHNITSPSEPEDGEFTDIVFIVDGRTGITSDVFELQKQGIRNSICGSEPVLPSDGSVAVAVIQFGDTTRVELPLEVIDSPGTAADICADIDAVEQLAGEGDLILGLAEAWDLLAEFAIGPERIVILSTDAVVANPDRAVSACAALRSMAVPVRICAIEVGNACDLTPPADSAVFLQACANTADSPDYYPAHLAGSYSCAQDAGAMGEYVSLCEACVCSSVHSGEADCNADGIPDACDPDCNENGVADPCDVLSGTSEDCNDNGKPDECEIDCNGNGVPDECELDCNGNGVPDREEGEGEGRVLNLDSTPMTWYATIQEAVDSASVDDTLIAFPGTYYENVTLTGFTATPITLTSTFECSMVPSAPVPDPECMKQNTIIDGCLGAGALEARAVVSFWGGAVSTIKGFTLTHGFGQCEVCPVEWDCCYGGGVDCHDSAPHIHDNIIVENSSDSQGGGIRGCDCEEIRIENNIIGANQVLDGGGGGGIALVRYITSKAGRNDNAIIQGNVIEGNTANAGGGIYLDTRGEGGLPGLWTEVTSNTLSENSAGTGGGLYSIGSGTSVGCCTFSENSSGAGGGIYIGGTFWLELAPIVSNCTFLDNDAVDGAGMHDAGEYWFEGGGPTVTGCTFNGNFASESGGGVYMFSTYRDGATLKMTRCTFTDNLAAVGGAMYSSADGGAPTVDRCSFYRNTASQGGAVYNFGGIPSPEGWPAAALQNSVFVGNTALGFGGGGAVFQFLMGELDVHNCTFTQNVATQDTTGGLFLCGSSVNIANSIFWGNIGQTVSPEEAQLQGSLEVNCTCIEGLTGDLGGARNHGCAPSFIRAADPGADGEWDGVYDDFGDLGLQWGSSCVDCGCNDLLPEDVLVDRDGHPRKVDDPGKDDCWQAPGECGTCPVLDMGAYEYQADCNDNSILDGCDLDCDYLCALCDEESCGGSEDLNGNGLPDECEEACCLPDGQCEDRDAVSCEGIGGHPQGSETQCATTICPTVFAPLPCQAPHDRAKNRFLSFEANNEVACAIQVELMGLQKCCTAGKTACVTNNDCAPGDTCEDCVQCFYHNPYGDVDMKWWVSNPTCTDLAGNPVVTAPPCVEPNVWRAQLTVDPVCHGGGNNDLPCGDDTDCEHVDGNGLCGREEWVEDCIHIGDCEVIPLATYALRATLTPLAADPIFSEDLTIETIRKPGTKCWADCVGQWEDPPGHWTPPNGVVSMDDVMAAVMYFKNHPNRPHRTWVEVDDLKPNMVLNMADVFAIVGGFNGKPYPFENPSACPAAALTASGSDRGDATEPRDDHRPQMRTVPTARVGHQTYREDDEPITLGIPALTILAPAEKMQPGELVSVEVRAGAAFNIGAYETALDVSGGDSGRLILEELFIGAEREDFVFASVDALPVTDEAGGRLGGVVLGEGVDVLEDGYLGTFVFRASPDASGTFYLDLRDGAGTFLRDGNAKSVPFERGPAVAITVQPPEQKPAIRMGR